MRVLFDYRAALREPSGVGAYAHELAAALLDVTASQPDTLDLTLFSSSWKDRLERPAELSRAGAVDRRIPVRVLNFAWHRLEWPPIETLIEGVCDVAHSLHPLLMPTRRAARIVTIYDLNFLLHPERTRAEIRRDYTALAREHANRADRVIVISEFTAAEVERLLGVPRGRISLCPPGAPSWPPRTRPVGDGAYALFLGTLEPRKNLDVLLDAYEQCSRNGTRLPRLLIAGKATEHAARWLDRINRPPLSHCVEYVGYVDPARRRQLYDGAKMLVQPSYEEGFGMPVLEAMTVGVPVIAANRGALPEVVGDAGPLLEPEDSAGFAEAIRRLAEDPAAEQVAIARGFARARLFSWRTTALTMLEAYQSANAQHRQQGAA